MLLTIINNDKIKSILLVIVVL